MLALVAVSPLLVEAILGSRSLSRFAFVRKAAEEHSAAYYSGTFAKGVLWALFALGLYRAFARVTRTRWFRNRVVGRARPDELAVVRIVVCGVLLVSTLWEDLPSTAYLPRKLEFSLGVLGILRKLPIGFERLCASPSALAVLQWGTAALLVAGILGWKTRRVLPAAAIGYGLLAGILRQYAWFYHTGLIPLFVVIALSFLPCGDDLSLDRWQGVRRGQPFPDRDRPRRSYAYARFLCWLVIALPYLEAGISKLRRSGLAWFDPTNMTAILVRDSLNPMEFGNRLSLRLVGAPPIFAAALGVAGVLSEVLFPLVLFSKPARRVLPLAAAGLHVGIVFLQNVLFFDLIALQLVFYDVAGLLRRFRKPDGAVVTARPAPSGAGWPRRLRTVAALFLFCWVIRIEWYPLTAMQMYSGVCDTGDIEYLKVWSIDGKGHRGRAPIERAIGAMRDARYRKLIRRSFEPGGREKAQLFLRACAERWNSSVSPADRVRRFEVERWHWNFLVQPKNPSCGALAEAWTVDVPDGTGSAAPPALAAVGRN